MFTKCRVGFLVLLVGLAGCSNQGGSDTADKSAANTAATAAKSDKAEKSETRGGLIDTLLGRPQLLTVPAGTSLAVRLVTGLSTERNSEADRFEATLDRAITIDGKVVAPAGSGVAGRVYHSKRSGKVKGRAELGLTLTALVVDGKTYAIDTNNWFSQASGTKKKDAVIIGGAAGVGGLVGAIAGGKKGAAIGAAVGGGAGTGGVLATRGKPVALGSEARLTFRLQKSIELPSRKQ
ncbi:MAG: hypothetical protein ACR2L2_00160 [Acidobacteriota bacterium]